MTHKSARPLTAAIRRLLTACALVVTVLAPWPALAQAPQMSAADKAALDARRAKVTALLDASGLKFDKVSERSWSITYRGDFLKEFEVRLNLYDDLLVFVTLIDKAPAVTSATVRKMLTMNFAADQAKLALDDDGQLLALYEAEIRLLDGAGVKRIASGLAGFADDSASALSRIPPMPPVGGPIELVPDHASLRYDAGQWTVDPPTEPGIFVFKNISRELYVKVIAEPGVVIAPEDVVDAIVLSMQKNAPDVKLAKRGTRNANGIKFITAEIDGTVEQTPITYYGHYLSDTSGTVQLLAWCAKTDLAGFRKVIEDFVAGLDVKK